MLLCGVDIETTGVDETSEITELSWVFLDLKTTEPPVVRQNFCKTKKPVPEEITKLTGIHSDFLNKWGMKLGDILFLFEQELGVYEPEYIVAHNGENFDKPFILRSCKEYSVPHNRISNTPWLDTGNDLPDDKFGTRKLTYMAAECGFINPFAHSAVFDILTMFRVLSNCNLESVIERSKQPWVTIRAMVDYNTKDKAKARKFRWENCGDGSTYPKTWVKRVRAPDVEKEKSEADFEVHIIG